MTTSTSTNIGPDDGAQPPEDPAARRVRIGEPIVRKSLIGRSRVEYAGRSANLYVGCAHDCKYCYARPYSIRRRWVEDDAAWSIVRPVADMLDHIRRETKRRPERLGEVHLCFMTDLFMYDPETGDCHEEIALDTLSAISALNSAGVPVSTLTKGVYPFDDVDWLHPQNRYGITVVSLNEDFRAEWEPGAAPIRRRIESREALADDGMRTWVSIEPYPTPNIDPTAGNIIELLENLPFVDEVVLGKMNYVTSATEYAKKHPEYYENVSVDAIRWCKENGRKLLIKNGTPHAGTYPVS